MHCCRSGPSAPLRRPAAAAALSVLARRPPFPRPPTMPLHEEQLAQASGKAHQMQAADASHTCPSCSLAVSEAKNIARGRSRPALRLMGSRP